jgi:hypothetical protein
MLTRPKEPTLSSVRIGQQNQRKEVTASFVELTVIPVHIEARPDAGTAINPVNHDDRATEGARPSKTVQSTSLRLPTACHGALIVSEVN